MDIFIILLLLLVFALPPGIVITYLISRLRDLTRPLRPLQFGIPEMMVLPLATLPTIAAAIYIGGQRPGEEIIMVGALALYQTCGAVLGWAMQHPAPGGWTRAMYMLAWSYLHPIFVVMGLSVLGHMLAALIA
jgi:hypothetical protein